MIAVVVVNWNAGVQLVEMFNSLNKASNLVGLVIIVDNNSTDNSLSEISVASAPFETKIIKNDTNRGFGAACNQGAELCSSKYILFLNPDTKIYPDTLKRVLEYMEQEENKNVGICGVQLIDEHNHVARSCARFPSTKTMLSKACGLSSVLGFASHFMREWDHLDTRQVDQVMGAFFFIRRDLFESLGGFDERFFVYFEEVDVSYRAYLSGWTSVYLSSAQAFHAGGGTSKQVKARRLFYSLRSRILYVAKHFSLLGMLLVVLATLFVEPLTRILQAALHRSWTSIKEVLIAYRLLFVWFVQWSLCRHE